MRRSVLSSLFTGALLAASAQIAFSQGTVYFVRSAFEAALNSSTTVTFEELPPTDWQGMPESSITTSGVTFTGPWARLYITNPSGLLYPIPGTGKYLWQFDGGYPLSSLLPVGVTAFGADLSGGIQLNSSFNAIVTVNLVGGQSYAYNFSAPTGSWTFFGVTFADPISSVIYDDVGHFSIGTHEEMLDNVTFGSVIPEPSSSLLLLVALPLTLWRRHSVRSRL